LTLTGVLFMTLYLAGSVLAFVRHPIYGLMTYVGVFYLNPPCDGGGRVTRSPLAVVASMVTLAAVLLRKEKCNNIPIMRHGIMYLMIAFLLWIGIQSVWALDQDMHQEMISMYLKFMIVIS